MKALITTFFLVSLAVLTGCMDTGLGLKLKNFFGSRDPCGVAESIHSAFLVFVNTHPVSAKAMAGERAGINGVREYCSAGDIKEVTLQKIVASYAAAVAAYKSE